MSWKSLVADSNLIVKTLTYIIKPDILHILLGGNIDYQQ